MSENGPREGTRDLPRPGKETGFRSMDDSTAAGQAYSRMSRRARRRRDELLELLRSGVAPSALASAFERDHPLEPPVSTAEVEQVVAEFHRPATRPQRVPPPPG